MAKRIVVAGLVCAVMAAAHPTVEEKPAASEPAAPATSTTSSTNEGQSVVEAMAAIGSIIAGAEQTEEAGTKNNNSPAGPAAAPAEAGSSQPVTKTNGEPAEVKKPRAAKQSVALITGGAAAGAALGAAMGKGSKGAMIGAALGGVAGLIYDRMTYKNPGKI